MTYDEILIDCPICDNKNKTEVIETPDLIYLKCLECGAEFGTPDLIQLNIKLRNENKN